MTTTATTYTPSVLCSTATMTEEEWLKWRTKGIGGSDAGTVLGVNPYKTKRELFYEKTGVKPVKAKDNNALPLRWGHALEETVAEEFSIQTGLRVYEVKEMYQHPLYSFMLANVDRFIDLPDGSVGILECKTANPNGKSKWEDGGVPFHYECQVRHYMAVMNIDVAYIACLFENSSDTMAIRKIERDPVFEEELIAAEKDFWENHVLKNNPPAFTEIPELCFETIDRYVQAQISKKAVTLKGFDEVLPTIAELKEKKKALEDEAKSVQSQIDKLILPIIDSMGTQTASTATVDGVQYDISYKPMDRTSINKDNLKRLQIGYPDVYDEFVTTTTSRRLTFKSKKV